MDGFMTAFNAEDADAIRKRWFNFPHVRFHTRRCAAFTRRLYRLGVRVRDDRAKSRFESDGIVDQDAAASVRIQHRALYGRIGRRWSS
jgi:hypothetical protein